MPDHEPHPILRAGDGTCPCGRDAYMAEDGPAEGLSLCEGCDEERGPDCTCDPL